MITKKPTEKLNKVGVRHLSIKKNSNKDKNYDRDSYGRKYEFYAKVLSRR